MKALGMIETYGLVAAVEALDSALKAAMFLWQTWYGEKRQRSLSWWKGMWQR